MRIYLASNYSSHPYMREVRRILERKGHIVTSRWVNGEHEIGNDDTLSRTYAVEDYEDLGRADACIWFSVEQSPRQRGGRHVEFGLALAWKIPIYVVGKKENVFHYLPQVKHFQDIESLITEIFG